MEFAAQHLVFNKKFYNKCERFLRPNALIFLWLLLITRIEQRRGATRARYEILA
nr:MAG TPA: hypothetical protein [Caudoviricetes sp.]